MGQEYGSNARIGNRIPSIFNGFLCVLSFLPVSQIAKKMQPTDSDARRLSGRGAWPTCEGE